jgi:diacylglycerol O-acyltransferase
LWEASLIEGLADGRFAIYFKIHHAAVDGVSALRLLQNSLSKDPATRDMLPPWASPPDAYPAEPAERHGLFPSPGGVLRSALNAAGDAAGLPSALVSTVRRGLSEEAAPLSFAAPKTMLNVPITGARRFAAQSWPLERISRVARSTGATLNDVVLAMCSGALRVYLQSLDALPDAPLIAMVPVALRAGGRSRESGNALGVVMCNLGTQLDDPADRLASVHTSMSQGKATLAGMSPMQIRAMSLLGVSPLALAPLFGIQNAFRPPFNLVISNVPGSRAALYYNGARLDGLYPLSIPVDGQALNITCTSYSGKLAFGLTGCRRSVPHLQRLLGHLDSELDALERAAALA